MPLKLLLASVFVLASCEHAVGLAELQEDAACTAANLSTTLSEIREEDVRGEIGGEMNFFCCQRQVRSSCEPVLTAEYYLSDIPINTSDTAKYNTKNEGGAELIVMDLAPTDQGKYTCSCPDTRLPPVEDSGIVLLFTPRSIPVFPYHVVEGTTALLPCPLSLLLGEFITSYQYRWNTLGAGDTIEGVFLGSGLLPLMEVGEEIDVCSNASEDQRICRNVNGTLRISNVSSDDAQKRYRCVVNGFQRDGKQVVRFDQSAVSKPIPLVIIKSLDLRVLLSSSVLRAGSNVTAHCQSASGRNLSLATEVLINGTPVTERDGYSLELVNLNVSGTVVCEAVQQGNNSRDLRDNASASFIVLDIPNVTFLGTANGRLLQRFNLTHSTQPHPLSVEYIISNADSAQTHFLSPRDCAPPIIQGSKPVLIPNALPPGTSSGVVQVDLQKDLPELNLAKVVLFVQFRLLLEGVRGGCSFTLPLRAPCPVGESVVLVATVTGVAVGVVGLVALAVTIPLTVCITLCCKKHGRLQSNRLTREDSNIQEETLTAVINAASDAEGGSEGVVDESSPLLGAH